MYAAVASVCLAGALAGSLAGCSNVGRTSREMMLRGLAKYVLCHYGELDAGDLWSAMVRIETVLSSPAYYSADADSLLRCYASATQCVDVRACSQCTADSWYCDGDTAVGCTLGLQHRRDCSADGHACADLGDWTVCSPGVCDASVDQPRCAGAEQLICQREAADSPTGHGHWVSYDCRATGFVDPICVEWFDVRAYAACVSSPLVACDPPLRSGRCDGNTAVGCGMSGYEVRYRCEGLPWRTSCAMGPEGYGPACQLSRDSCGPGDSGCIGDVARLCLEGIPVEIDCSAFFASCSSDGSDTSCSIW
jgi:hypothetical protein